MTKTFLVKSSPSNAISTFRIVQDDSGSLLVDTATLLALSVGFHALQVCLLYFVIHALNDPLIDFNDS